ncbi:carboxypeptidase-like regulatory domain-containing protein [Marivirga arenosa]|uniref:Carboxypeptidase-like regulatory domain-containing protein n=1 Tax=Marivirga arenosa TaxID=3059076 RepID=A0AA51ZXA8_9BACT|nr:carboxypeptidase-like regulatory domain-containing protein [Marivirga sp. BKB1-2]WNB18464.1 carboxypeptidase-like regulatory domain-containing protein [Marivirga sp. BKB1-2]
MKINNLLKMCLGMLAMTVIISSCADEFTEEDLLQAQYDLQQQQQNAANARQDSIDNAERQNNIDALNDAGELVSLQLTIVDLDGTPVEGADVSLRAAAGGDADEQTATSAANGTVYFDRVAIGGNTINISGAGITPATLQADFGSIQQGVHYEIIDGIVIPTPVTESAVITVISSNAATATVSGTVNIETDVTNTTPEVPQDLTIRANFTNNLSRNASFSLNYFFSNSGNEFNVGESAVDNTTGDYELIVPANINFTMTVPDLTLDQTIAIDRENGVLLDRPEYRTVEANFGPNSGSDNIRAINGAIVVFDEPNGGGSGFVIDSWARVPRDFGFTAIGNNTTKTDGGSFVYQFTSLGSGYVESPLVTITDPNAGAENLYAEAHLDFAINGLTLSQAGSGFPADTDIDFDFRYDSPFYDATEDDVDTTENIFVAGSILSVRTNAAGAITADSVAAALAQAIEDEDNWFDQDDLNFINNAAVNLRLQTGGAVPTANDAILDITSMKSRIRAMAFQGDNLTNPSFTFSGGGATAQAVIDISAFETRWTFALNNDNVEPYSSVPGISFDYFNANINPQEFNSTQVRVLDLEGNFQTTASIQSRLEVDADGDIVYQDAVENNETNFFAANMPSAVIVNPQAGVAPTGTVAINNNGEVTGVNISNFGTSTNGSNTGYTEKFGAMIMVAAEGAPGSGAEIVLGNGIFNADGTYQWFGGRTITENGTGYLQDLNQQNAGNGQQGFFVSSGNINSTRNLNEGQNFVLDINYGTGNKVGNF